MVIEKPYTLEADSPETGVGAVRFYKSTRPNQGRTGTRA